MVSIAATNSATVSAQSLLSQSQLVQAREAADQAEQHARQLRQQADEADKQAQQWRDEAQGLSTQLSNAASGTTASAGTSITAGLSGNHAGSSARFTTSYSSSGKLSLQSGGPSVVNAQGQTTGTIIHVTA